MRVEKSKRQQTRHNSNVHNNESKVDASNDNEDKRRASAFAVVGTIPCASNSGGKLTLIYLPLHTSARYVRSLFMRRRFMRQIRIWARSTMKGMAQVDL